MMSKIAESALDLIGNTPLLKLNRYSAEAGVRMQQSWESWSI